MTENIKIPVMPSGIGLLITLMFFVIMGLWTLFFLFVIPEIQKKYLIAGNPIFLEFQADTGLFTIIGYICFALLAVSVLAVLVTPNFSKTEGFGVFILVLFCFWFVGIAESICSYSYITDKFVAVRTLFSFGEKRFNWDNIKRIKVSFYNTSSTPKKGTPVRMMKWDIMPDERYSITIRECTEGEQQVTTVLFRNLKNSDIFSVDEEDRVEWNDTVEIFK